MIDILTVIILDIGLFFILLGSLGILKLPDSLCRAHALSKALTLGISLMLIALWIHLGDALSGVKIFLTIVFLFFTIPLSGHIFALFAVKNSEKS